MDRETLIILALVAGGIFFIWLLLSIINKAPIKISRIVVTDEQLHKAEVLEQMFRLRIVLQRFLYGRYEGYLTDSEKNVLAWKIMPSSCIYHYFYVTVPVNEKALRQWLKDPRINRPYPPDKEAMNQACKSYLSIRMAENMLRRILGKNFSAYYKRAEYELEAIINLAAQRVEQRELFK